MNHLSLEQKNFLEINDESRGTYKNNNQIKFETSMVRSNLSDYSDAYVLVSRTITITGSGDDNAAKRADERNKGAVFKNCAPITECISNINNAQTDNAKYINAGIPMYNLIEYNDNYSKIIGSLWQYCRDEPSDQIVNPKSFESKIKITGNTRDNEYKRIFQILVPLKYLRNFWRTLKMPLIVIN